ncbi:MAG TPA: cytochrome c oxidase subunit 3 [Candidatus Binatia bacterium]|nr:cytochrome c oxidase subunit 3 [Candidatus Binatia bacterium]
MTTDTMTLSGAAEPHGKAGTWWFLASEIPTFGGLLVSYIVMRLGSSGWSEASSHLNFTIALINTLILLTSSMTIVMAHAAVQERDDKRAGLFLGLTVLLGAAFLGMKGFEYWTEIDRGFFPSSGLFWSFYYGLTGLHALHVLFGVAVNSILWIQASKGALAPNGHRVELAGLYWHFVDIVWIFLFPLLYLA